jgi:hypothetical protein
MGVAGIKGIVGAVGAPDGIVSEQLIRRVRNGIALRVIIDIVALSRWLVWVLISITSAAPPCCWKGCSNT